MPIVLVSCLIFQQQSGPPDLDELINRFLRKLSGQNSKSVEAFRRNEGSGGSNRSSGGMGLLPLNLIVALVCSVALFFFVITGFYTVDQSERAVTFRFGKPTGVRQPGLRWIMPFIEDYQIVNLTSVRSVEIGYRGSQSSKIARESLMLTSNLNIIDLQFAVQYVVENPEQYLYENRSPEQAVQQVAETAMREVVGRNNIDFVLYEAREQVARDTRALMQEILNHYETGISVQQVAIQNVQPPDQVQDAFEDAIKARQDYDRKINEGEAYANRVVPQAEGLSARMLQEAEAYRQSQIAIAQGSSERFTLLAEQFSKAPEVTRQRMYLDAIEDVMARSNKILLDQREGSNSLLYLPLDQIAGAALPRGGFAGDDSFNQLDNALPRSSTQQSGRQNDGRLTIEQIREEVRRRVSGGNQ